jgi:hypothetical protein
MRRMTLPLFVMAWLVATRLPAACPCMIQFGVCDEARQSDAVFIGTVESVAPAFLDPYARAKAMASLPVEETARLQSDPSPEALTRLKKIYLDLFTGLPDFARAQIAQATTSKDLQNAFESAQAEGRVARFHVGTNYKSDDDAPESPKTPDAPKTPEAPKTLDIWTGSGDCGINFQVGETYLVYAIEDEDSGKLETSICMRTRRLSEETGDLGFLYFLENSPKQSTRLEGFVSSSFTDQNLPRYEDAVSLPAPGAILELDSGTGLRYTQSDSAGRFAFDGLQAGDYRLSLLAPGFPQASRTVIMTRAFHADEASCVRQILVEPKRPATPRSQ